LCAGPAFAAENAPERVISTDVLVVGAGGAGLNAAITAAMAHAKVIVLEKQPTVGGATIISGGSMNFPDPKRQEKQGIKDSPDLMYEQTLAAGDYRADPALVRTLADNAPGLMSWYESLGVKWDDRVFEPFGGLFPRGHNTGAASAGRDYVRALYEAAKANNVEIRVNTKALELIRDAANGPVSGVRAADEDGPVTFRAKAVVIASGGFAGNVKMRMKYDPRLNETFRTTANPSGTGPAFNTGDGIVMAQKVGADVVGMDYIQLIPFTGGRVTDYVGADIWLNSDGKRFVSEGGRRDVITEALMRQKGQMCWVITDEQSVKGATTEGKIKSGVVFKLNTLKEVAAKIGVDPNVLQSTLDHYNKFAAEKQDPDFGRTTFTQLINKPPYYVGIERESVHFTQGGLRINSQTQVLDLDGNAIPALFAAGETTGGIHGSNRAGGNALTAISVFGRIAGKNAASLAQAQ
jgi:fumarate reductase flavoprotein subunit/urocanate reductase